MNNHLFVLRNLWNPESFLSSSPKSSGLSSSPKFNLWIIGIVNHDKALSNPLSQLSASHLPRPIATFRSPTFLISSCSPHRLPTAKRKTPVWCPPASRESSLRKYHIVFNRNVHQTVLIKSTSNYNCNNSLEDFISMQNEELAAQRQEIESLRNDKSNVEGHYQVQFTFAHVHRFRFCL